MKPQRGPYSVFPTPSSTDKRATGLAKGVALPVFASIADDWPLRAGMRTRRCDFVSSGARRGGEGVKHPVHLASLVP